MSDIKVDVSSITPEAQYQLAKGCLEFYFSIVSQPGGRERLDAWKVKEAELARRMDTTPQAFNQRMKTGKFKYEELEQMAQAMGAELVVNFRFPDGTEV